MSDIVQSKDLSTDVVSETQQDPIQAHNVHIEFSDLKNRSCTLVDAGSLHNFLDAPVMRYLNSDTNEMYSLMNSGKIFANRYSHLSESQRHQVLINFVCSEYLGSGGQKGLQAALMLLEKFVCYDHVVCDNIAMKTRGLSTDRFPKFVQTTEVPFEVYQSAAERVTKNKSGFLSRILQTLPRNYFHGGDKAYFDVFNKQLRSIPRNIADSSANHAVMRAVFYLEVSLAAKVPLTMSPEKTSVVTELEQACKSSLHERVVQLTSDPLREKWGKWFGDSGPPVLSIGAPPIGAMILSKSALEKKSLLEATLELREDAHARAYRQWLFELSKKQAGAVLHGNIRPFVKELANLERIAQEWAEHSDVRHMVEFKVRRFDLSKLPYIGWVFGAAGVQPFEILDPFLTPAPKYLVFISNWYHPTDKI